MVQRYSRYEGVGGCQHFKKKPHVTLEWPRTNLARVFYTEWDRRKERWLYLAWYVNHMAVSSQAGRTFLKLTLHSFDDHGQFSSDANSTVTKPISTNDWHILKELTWRKEQNILDGPHYSERAVDVL